MHLFTHKPTPLSSLVPKVFLKLFSYNIGHGSPVAMDLDSVDQNLDSMFLITSKHWQAIYHLQALVHSFYFIFLFIEFIVVVLLNKIIQVSDVLFIFKVSIIIL